MNHPCLLTLGTEIDLKHMCGFITMLKTGMPRSHMIKSNITRSKKLPTMLPNKISNEVKAQREEIDEFLHDLKELGIGGMDSEPHTPTDIADSTQKQEIKNRIVSISSELDTRPQLDWVPLEMSIGIPLFSGDINKTVCEKVYLHTPVSLYVKHSAHDTNDVHNIGRRKLR